jgi:hypothetical protein
MENGNEEVDISLAKKLHDDYLNVWASVEDVEAYFKPV